MSDQEQQQYAGILTPEGKKALEDELEHLLNVERPRNKEELSLARSQGDLSENADYDAARNKQAEIEGRIRQIKVMLDTYKVVVKDEGNGSVQVGSQVEVTRQDTGVHSSYLIVGSSEVDLKSEPKRIAYDSPIGQALMGRSKGDLVQIQGPRPYKVKIDKVL